MERWQILNECLCSGLAKTWACFHPEWSSITPLRENENYDYELEPLMVLYHVSILVKERFTKKQVVE